MTKTPVNSTPKKQWAKPELEIISQGYVDAKSHPSVKEGTGRTIGPNGFFTYPGENIFFIGPKTEAIS